MCFMMPPPIPFGEARAPPLRVAIYLDSLPSFSPSSFVCALLVPRPLSWRLLSCRVPPSVAAA